MDKQNKQIVISGIQPTGKLHLGNYLGVLQNFINLHNEGKFDCYFFIADIHSLTEKIDPREKRRQIIQTAAEVRALGISHESSTFFIQSSVPAHSELAIILNNLTPFPELQRMTQFKDKSANQPKNINVGLFDYPVLMAADILLYDAEFVTVGDDQLQHLEFTRTLARKFNSTFGKTFVEPKPKLTATPRLMSLDDPTKKMSKSRPAGCIFLSDSIDVIQQKIKRAVTDSGQEIKYDPEKKPAISNLMMINAAFLNPELIGLAKGSPISQKLVKLEKIYKGYNYAKFKREVAIGIAKIWGDIWKQKSTLLTDNKILEELEIGNKKANVIASDRIREIKQKIGLIY